MRFNQLNAKAYGHFTDFQLDFSNNHSFHIIFGPNEAGKSTMLRAFRSFLFGIEHVTKDSFKHQNANLRIEGTITSASGTSLSFARKKGRTNTILPLDGGSMTDEKLQSILQINEEFFKNLFGLDYKDLRAGGQAILTSGGNVGASIFAASSGMNHIRDVLKKIKAAEENLYKEGRAKREIDHLIEEFRHVKKEVQEKSLTSMMWNQLQKKKESLQEKIDSLEKEKRELAIQLLKLERIKRNLPLFAKRENLLNELKNYENVKVLPEGLAKERESLQAELNHKKLILQNAMLKVQSLQDEIEKIKIQEELFDYQGEIEKLYRQIEMYRKYTEQLPSLLNNLEHAEFEARQILTTVFPKATFEKAEEQYKLTLQEKQTIRYLATEYETILNSEQTNIREIQNLTSKIQLKKEELSLLGENLTAPVKLRDRIETIKAEGKIEAMLHELLLEIEELQAQLELEMKLLQVECSSIDQFLALSMPPDEIVIQDFVNQFKQIDKQLSDIQTEIDYKNSELNKIEEQLRKIANRNFLTRQDLDDARSKRNQNWNLIRNAMMDEKKVTDTLQAGFEQSMNETDMISDQLIEEASIIGENKKLLKDKEEIVIELKQLKERQEERTKEKQKLEQHWFKLCSNLPLNYQILPDQMIEWRKKFIFIRQNLNKLESLKRQRQLVSEKVVTYKEQLCILLKNNEKIDLDENDTLENLLKQAETVCVELEEKARTAKNMKELISENERLLKIELQNKSLLDEQFHEWTKKWEKAIERFSINHDIRPEIVIEMINKLDNFFSAMNNLKKEKDRITEIRTFIIEMEKNAKECAESIYPEFCKKDVETIVVSLYEMLTLAKEEMTILKEKKRQLILEQNLLQDTKNEVSVLENRLNELLAETNCTSIEELIELEMKSQQINLLKRQLSDIENQILDNGSGLQINQLLEEAKGTESDGIMSDCESIELKIETLEAELKQIYQEYGVVKKEYDETIEGNSIAALEAAERKERILEEIRKKTEKFILLRLSSVVLSKGIERFRELNQGPIIKRASRIFSQITLGSFIDLIVDFDDKDQLVFKGIRRNGDYVQVEGMSDGTQDQLYLALRIASIEHYMKENEPIPFIVDDILVHFDDERSKETLKVLAELSTHTQIIFFTHHQKLLDLAREVLPQNKFESIDLNQKVVVKS